MSNDYTVGGLPVTAIIGALSSGKKNTQVYVDIYSAPGSHIWVKRPKVKYVSYFLWAGGGGGGGGALAFPSSSPQGCGSGGAGGMGGQVYYTASVKASLLKSTGTVFVGTGGSGGIAGSTTSTYMLMHGSDGQRSSVTITIDGLEVRALGGYGGEGGDGSHYINFSEGAFPAQGGGNYTPPFGPLGPPTYSGYGGNSSSVTNWLSNFDGKEGGFSVNTTPIDNRIGATTLYTSVGGGGGGGVVNGSSQYILTTQGYFTFTVGNGGNSGKMIYNVPNTTTQIIVTASGGLAAFNTSTQSGQSGTTTVIIQKFGNTTASIYYSCGGGGGAGAKGSSTATYITKAGDGGDGSWPGAGGGGGGAVGYTNFVTTSIPRPGSLRSGAGGKGGDGLVIIISYT
jgi:hypothetical protein